MRWVREGEQAAERRRADKQVTNTCNRDEIVRGVGHTNILQRTRPVLPASTNKKHPIESTQQRKPHLAAARVVDRRAHDIQSNS